MNIKILEQKEEPLLSRKAVKAEIFFENEATPSNQLEMTRILAQNPSILFSSSILIVF